MSMIRLAFIFILLIQLIACGGSDSASPSDSESSVNLLPTAFSGEDKTVHQQTLVTLSGTGTDSDGTVTSFRWKQTEGTTVSLSGDDTDIINFTSPVLDVTETLVFELTVIDNEGANGVDTISIVVLKPQEISGIVLDYKTSLGIANTTISASHFIGGVSYKLGEILSSSDGSFLISYYRPTIGRINLTANITGYAEHSIIVESSEDALDVNSNISLLPVSVSQTFDASNNVSISIEGQQAISISGSSLVREDGEGIIGLVTGEVTVIDASTDTSVMPGDFLSIDSGNVVNQIESFGALNITFVDESGNKVNLKEGESAQIYIPISDSIDPVTAPISMPLFYYDEDKGYWVEEGVSTLTELEANVFAYVGIVGHFTTWNADRLYDRSYVVGCLQEANGDPLVSAKIKAEGVDYNGSSLARTNINGEFKVAVKPLSKVKLNHVGFKTNLFGEIFSLAKDLEYIFNTCSDIQPEPIIHFTAEALIGGDFKFNYTSGFLLYHFSSGGSCTIDDGDGPSDCTWRISAGSLIVTTEDFEDTYTLTSGTPSSGTIDTHIVDNEEGISDDTSGTIELQR